MQPTSKGWLLVITIQVLQFFVFLAVAIRIYTRLYIVRKVWIDDWLCVAAVTACVAMTTLFVLQVTNGLGQHIQNAAQHPAALTNLLKQFFATLILYNIALTATKCALIFQCMRFISHGRYRKICWVIFVIVIACGIAFVLDCVFLCSPIRFFWDKTLPNGKCHDSQPTWMVNAGLDILTDLVIILLPIPALRTLQLPGRQKIFLFLIFLTAGFAVIVSIIRIHSIHISAISHDSTYDNVDGALWSCVEVEVGIICSCIVSYRPLFKAIPRLTRHSTNIAIEHPPTIGQDPRPRGNIRRFLHSFSALYTTRIPTSPEVSRGTVNTSTQVKGKPEELPAPAPAMTQVSGLTVSRPNPTTHDVERGEAV